MALAQQAVERQKEASWAETFIRFNVWHRIEHWLLAGCFVALLITGLPQKFSDAGLSVWVINALGGIDNARFLHRVLASIFMIEAILHLGEIALSILQRRFKPSMLITFRDFRDAFHTLRYSIGLIADKPAFDRYDYRQKFEYWGIIFGAVIMITTGLVLWFPTYATRILPGQIVPAAKEMHSGEALMALLIIVIWHFYDVMLSPRVFPLDVSMVNGKISRERMIEEHPREYVRLVRQELPMANLSPSIAAPTGGTAVGAAQPRAGATAGRRAASPGWAGVIRRSLHVRVMILVTIGIAAIMAAFSISSFMAVNESIDRSLDERRALAQATARHVDYALRQDLKALEEASFGDGFDLSDSDPEPERRALQRIAADRTFSLVYLADSRGAVLWTEPLYPWTLGMGLGSRPSVEAALENGEPAVSGLVTAMSGDDPAVSIVVPLRDRSGQMAGLIGGDIALKDASLTDAIRPAAAGNATYAQIVDNQGAVLASTRPGQLLEKSDHEGQVATLIAEKRTASGTCHGCHESAGEAERENEVMAFAPLESAPWGVLIRQSEDEALAPARRLKERAIWFGVPAFFVALLFAWATTRSVLRPVRVLTGAAEKISSGDLSEPVPNLGVDEIGTLATAFETMRVKLRESLESIQAWGRQLEARVHERTQELEASRDHLRAVAEENVALYEEVRRKEVARSDLLKKVIGAQEEERRRIARELHDETSQALTALMVGMETMTLAPEMEAGEVQKKLEVLKELAVATLDDVHRLIFDLRPSVLDDLGLVAGLRWYAESRLPPAGVRIRVLVTGEERRLPAEVETALFRIGQEAISNAVRHAQAANVVVGLDFQDGHAVLEVEDDGVGFDVATVTEPAAPRPGWGILGIQERAALLGGTSEIVSEPGSGTRLKVSIPLEEESDGDAKDSRPHSR
jgi:signal transduction histidine kinase/cytochrome b subunit of formate dehydrogenase